MTEIFVTANSPTSQPKNYFQLIYSASKAAVRDSLLNIATYRHSEAFVEEYSKNKTGLLRHKIPRNDGILEIVVFNH